MSREVLGSALEDVSAPARRTTSTGLATGTGSPTGPVAEPVATRSAVRLDDAPAADAAPAPSTSPSSAPSGGRPARDRPRDAHGTLLAGRDWTTARLDEVRRSRHRTAAALVVVALAAALLAVGVTEQVRQARADAATGVVAWLDYSDGGTAEDDGRASVVLNVVNTGADPVRVTGADFEGGLEGRSSGVALELDDDLVVAPSGYVSGAVRASVADCSAAPVARGGSRDGDLRVLVAGADLREEVLPGTRIGSFPITSSAIFDLACRGGFDPTIVVQGSSVRLDGRLYLTLKGYERDVEVSLTAPDGLQMVTEPASPVTVKGGENAPMTTIAVAVQVDTCTVAAQQLDAGSRVQIVADGERFPDLDYQTVNAWIVREVGKVCD